TGAEYRAGPRPPAADAEHRTGSLRPAADADHRAGPVPPSPGTERRAGVPAEPQSPATSPTSVPAQPDRQGTATDTVTPDPGETAPATDPAEATRASAPDRTTTADTAVPGEATEPDAMDPAAVDLAAVDPDPTDTGFVEPTFPGLAGFDFGAAPADPAALTQAEPTGFAPTGPAGFTQAEPIGFTEVEPTGFTHTGPAGLAHAGPQEIDVIRLTMSWAQTPLGGLAPPGLHAGPVHVVDGGSGLATAVAAELTARGLAAEVATHPGLGGVIFLGGMARPASPDAALEAQLTALWLARNGKDRGIFVTVADTVSGRAGAWLGGLVGLVGAVGRDRPAASAIAIECERGDRDPADVAVLIADELTRGAGAQRVRVAADGTRSVGRLVSAGAGAPQLTARCEVYLFPFYPNAVVQPEWLAVLDAQDAVPGYRKVASDGGVVLFTRS
ncbi:hypothetical protein AB0C29_41620, partial [Actinoplanes sp. NPDC048791]|uniref:hypothetical protein n=1 Tax=Actinoplanes sp. NPDC048791 TaxID=3154623 RepID=UPI0033E4A7D5